MTLLDRLAHNRGWSEDERLVLDFLVQEKVLLVQGSAFNLATPDHFRLVFLPRVDQLDIALNRLEHFLQHYDP